MRFFAAGGKERELPGPDRAFRFKRDPDIDHDRTFGFRPVERTDPVRPHPRSGNIGGNNPRCGSICHPDTGRERFLYRSPASGPDQGIDNDIRIPEQRGQAFEIVTALERVETDSGVPECHKIVVAGFAPFLKIQIADMGLHPALEIAGCHHPVAAVVTTAAQHQHTFRMKPEHLIGKTAACAFHQLELGHP